MIKNKFFIKQNIYINRFVDYAESYETVRLIITGMYLEKGDSIYYATKDPARSHITEYFEEDEIFATLEEAEAALNKVIWKVGDECYFLLGGRIRKGKVTQDSDILKGYQILFNNKEIINCYFEEMFKTKAELLKYLDESCDD